MANNPIKIMQMYVAFQRSLYTLLQQAHWQNKGENFYGNHLLFERLYKVAEGDLDAAAEKTVGLYNPETIDMSSIMPIVQKICDKYSCKDNDYITCCLNAYQDFIKFAKNAYDSLKESGDLTLGLDDMIMSQCSNAETAIYLLKQVKFIIHDQ
jgi:DNA-binding ferritin-like protein